VADTTADELLAWAGLAPVVARVGRTGDCRWWLANGLLNAFDITFNGCLSAGLK